MNVKTRQKIERNIARSAVKALIADGYTVDVFDGEETVLRASTSIKAIMAAMFTTDEDQLTANKGDVTGWIHFVYGNDGWDVISDYTTNLEAVLRSTNELADKLEDGNV